MDLFYSYKKIGGYRSLFVGVSSVKKHYVVFLFFPQMPCSEGTLSVLDVFPIRRPFRKCMFWRR